MSLALNVETSLARTGGLGGGGEEGGGLADLEAGRLGSRELESYLTLQQVGQGQVGCQRNDQVKCQGNDQVKCQGNGQVKCQGND